jgi:hypothetical protein
MLDGWDLHTAGLDVFLNPQEAAAASKDEWEKVLAWLIALEFDVLRQMLEKGSSPEKRTMLKDVQSQCRQLGSHIQSLLKSLQT